MTDPLPTSRPFVAPINHWGNTLGLIRRVLYHNVTLNLPQATPVTVIEPIYEPNPPKKIELIVLVMTLISWSSPVFLGEVDCNPTGCSLRVEIQVRPVNPKQ